MSSNLCVRRPRTRAAPVRPLDRPGLGFHEGLMAELGVAKRRRGLRAATLTEQVEGSVEPSIGSSGWWSTRAAAPGPTNPGWSPCLRPVRLPRRRARPPSSSPAISAWFELAGGRWVTVASSDGALTVDYGMGVYRLVPESDARFHIEDMEDPVLFEPDSITGLATGVFPEQLAYMVPAPS